MLHFKALIFLCFVFAVSAWFMWLESILIVKSNPIHHNGNESSADNAADSASLLLPKIEQVGIMGSTVEQVERVTKTAHDWKFITIPSDMLNMMSTDCWYEHCGVIVERYNDSVELRNKLMALGQKHEVEERRDHWALTDVLDLNHTVISGEGDVTICTDENRLKDTIGSFGCNQNPPQAAPGLCYFSIDSTAHDRAIVITQMWGNGYFHALIEGLPRLMAAFHYLDLRGESKHDWVVHSMLAEPLATQIAQFAGVRAFVSGLVRAHRLLMPMPTHCGGSLGGINTVRVRAFVRDHFSTSLLHLNKEQHERMLKRSFVLVKRTGRRSLANHDEILEACRRLWKGGDVLEHFGDTPFEHQMEMLYSASVIMGPHGSGLSNAIAMDIGSSMIEVLPETNHNRFNVCYLTLAFTLGLKYYALRAPGFDSEGVGVLPISGLKALPVWSH